MTSFGGGFRNPGLSPRHVDQNEFCVVKLKHKRVKIPLSKELLKSTREMICGEQHLAWTREGLINNSAPSSALLRTFYVKSKQMQNVSLLVHL